LLLKKKPIPLRRSDSLNPDGFVSYTLTPPFGLPGEPVAFCFEIDNNANESETQVREKLEKYLYAATGTYQERFDVNTLTVAFCVPGNTKRVDELVKIAEKVLHQHKEYAPLFLFGSFDFTDLDPITVFTTPQWHTPCTTTLQTLIEKRA